MNTLTRQDAFFSMEYRQLVDSPNGGFWFMSMPLPDGDRISGNNPDKCREQKLWKLCRPAMGTLKGKHVLDIGANDGYFTIAACLSGAESVTALNTEELIHGTYPANLEYASRAWGVEPLVRVGDFTTAEFEQEQFDVILFFGVLYHLENVYAAFRRLKDLLAPGGVVCLETQTTSLDCPRPVFEMASDSFHTTVPQYKSVLATVGNSNYLLPNEAAVRALADTYDLSCEAPEGRGNLYEASVGPTRRVFFLRHK